MIEMQEVDKNYNDFHFHLSMKIHKGQITGLNGKNGAGKRHLPLLWKRNIINISFGFHTQRR